MSLCNSPCNYMNVSDGPLTVTDANLVLGRLIPKYAAISLYILLLYLNGLCVFSYFPHIFGPNKNLPVDSDATCRAFDELTDQVNTFIVAQPEPSHPMTREEVAMGFIRVANETMCRPIRALTQVR